MRAGWVEGNLYMNDDMKWTYYLWAYRGEREGHTGQRDTNTRQRACFLGFF